MGSFSRTFRSPRALLVFEAAARLGSCSAAAREFNLTQPSVSRNIAELETALATKLFIRKPTGLELSADGESLYRSVSSAISRIDETIREIGERNAKKQVVELSLSTAFVTHWFVPRMREFHRAFPDVDLRFQLVSGALKRSARNVDLAMCKMEHGKVEERVWRFAPELVLPVCSRSYLAQCGELDPCATQARHVLLELTDAAIGWRNFFEESSIAAIRPENRIEFSDYAVVLQTALSGQGTALGWVSAISRMLVDETLVAASARRLVTGCEFSLMVPRGRPSRQVVLDIKDWMIEQMAGDLAALESLLHAPAPAVRRKRRSHQ